MHAGNTRTDEDSRRVGGPIRTPITLANSYHLPDDPSTVDWSATGASAATGNVTGASAATGNATGASAGLFYSRNTGANQLALQVKLAALDHGEDAVALASGVAALHAIFFTHVAAGDHVVVSDTTYEATWKLWSSLLPRKYGIEATFVDVTDLDAVRAALRPTTRLVITEAVANPTTKIADVAALADIAHGSGALLVVDSTFTPPPLYRPLADGADLVAHSLTKYINGHGDAMGGAVIGRAELIEPIKAEAMVDVGGVISPFNAWLISRGSITLPLRLAQHQASARHLAEFLDTDDRVAFVAYPGLASHPQHALAARQFGGRGFGAMMAFALDGTPDDQNRFVSHLRVITSAVSLGHDESLIVHVGTDGPRVAAYPDEFRRWGHLRFSVGLEDVEDLEADLRAALDATFG
nr:aminotransferase class V-fold PLP-dependent enzyme [Gordonia insulae]